MINVLKDIVKREEDVAAIFPFKSLDPGKFGSIDLDPAKARQDIEIVRRWIEDAKRIVTRNVDSRCSSARKKWRCLTRILNIQLSVCEQMESLVDQMSEEFPARSFVPEYFPGLFDAGVAAKAKK